MIELNIKNTDIYNTLYKVHFWLIIILTNISQLFFIPPAIALCLIAKNQENYLYYIIGALVLLVVCGCISFFFLLVLKKKEKYINIYHCEMATEIKVTIEENFDEYEFKNTLFEIKQTIKKSNILFVFKTKKVILIFDKQFAGLPIPNTEETYRMFIENKKNNL